MEREELLEAARDGDTAALSSLLDLCQPDLRRYAQAQCSSGDVDDAVQDALWIIHERFRALRYAAAFSSWLFHVVQRICWRLNRKADRLTPLEDVFPVAGAGEDSIHLRMALRRLLAQLDPTYREVLLLRDMYGYISEETAERLGISVDAAKSRPHRARFSVRNALVQKGTS